MPSPAQCHTRTRTVRRCPRFRVCFMADSAIHAPTSVTHGFGARYLYSLARTPQGVLCQVLRCIAAAGPLFPVRGNYSLVRHRNLWPPAIGKNVPNVPMEQMDSAPIPITLKPPPLVVVIHTPPTPLLSSSRHFCCVRVKYVFLYKYMRWLVVSARRTSCAILHTPAPGGPTSAGADRKPRTARRCTASRILHHDCRHTSTATCARPTAQCVSSRCADYSPFQKVLLARNELHSTDTTG